MHAVEGISMRRERSFVPRLPAYGPSAAWREDLIKKVAARYPGCTDWPADEALLICCQVLTLEKKDAAYIVWVIRHCGLQIPPRLRHDRYRLIKYLYSHWHTPTIRERILTKATIYKRSQLQRDTTDLTPAKANKLLRDSTPTYLLAPLRVIGLGDTADAILAMQDEEGLAYYRGDVLLGQIICHKLWREKDPTKTPLRERRTLVQRLRRRNLQLHLLQRSLYHLDRERKGLVRQTWEVERAAGHSLDELIRQQELLQAELTMVTQSHSERLAALRASHAEALSLARAKLEARRQELEAALAERGQWSIPWPLAGQAVLILGDRGHADAYRDVVEALGGRPLLIDGRDHLGRIREVAPEADAAIVVSAAIKHSAETALSASVRPGTPVLYCPRAGKASLERTLRAELLPRLIARRVAISQQGGDPDAS
jgi:hypothetical protein